MADLAEYWIFKRPKIGDTVIYGEAKGAKLAEDGTVQRLGPCLYYPKIIHDAQGSITDSTLPDEDGNYTVKGEPWIMHSVHFSQSDALHQLKLVVQSIGEENVKLVKIMPHEVVLQLK